ncbi:MAG: hypothetical protein L3J54_12505, partial [Draconibacterium sp.]|nr:hypothetical protein [Draconibacterium sp.]
NIPITVSAGCNNAALCDGHDFGTGFIKGFLAPEVTGNYTFYIKGDSDFALFLSSDENFENATAIAASSDKHGKVGSVTANGRKSDPVYLEEDKIYAIYAVQWNVHNENGGVKWELQGEFGVKYIDGSFLYPEYDTERPEAVTKLNAASVGDRFVRVSWSGSVDNQKVSGYNIYLNGLKINKKLISRTEYLIENLAPETDYSIAVSAVDLVQNESFINQIVNATTLSLDTIPPNPPTSLMVDEAAGVALQVSWNGATDEASGIYGYNIYLDGELVNTDSVVYGNTIILKVLAPLTKYDIEIEAIDIGMNVSGKSDVFSISTVEFDPLDENLGVKTGSIELSLKAISFNEGLGINPNFKNGEVFNSVHTKLLKDLQPGAIRWGALTANPLSFSSYVGAGKSVTIGRFFKRCNDLDAYTVFCCGVENSTDWIKNDETFIRFLEYINGPDETEGGRLRVAEGYTEPFLKNSKGLIFEFGNEVWGGDAHRAQIGENYNNYAKWCRKIATKMRASEYYDSTKITLTYSARYPSREYSYGLNDKLIIGDAGEVDWTAPSGYLGGNLNYDPALPAAESELEYYKNVRQRADKFLSGIILAHKFEVEKTGRIFKQYMYESNTTTPTYNGRLGQALLSTDYYLTAMELGSAIPTLFHLTGGEWRITESENNYRRMPLFLTAKYFNKFCKGDVLYNKYYSNQMGVSEPGAPFGKRPVGAHTYRNKDGYTVVLISRDYIDDHFVQIDLPDDFNVNSEGKMYSITGEDFNTKLAVIDSVDIIIKDKMLIKVPKYGMVFLRFLSDSIEIENLPLAHYIYPRMEDVSIYAPKNRFTKPNERLSFRVTFTPSNSWDNIVEWSLLNNSGNYSFNVEGTFCYVYSGNLVGNETDSLILRASNRYGDIYDEVVIYLPETPVNSDLIEDNSGFFF